MHYLAGEGLAPGRADDNSGYLDPGLDIILVDMGSGQYVQLKLIPNYGRLSQNPPWYLQIV